MWGLKSKPTDKEKTVETAEPLPVASFRKSLYMSSKACWITGHSCNSTNAGPSVKSQFRARSVLGLVSPSPSLTAVPQLVKYSSVELRTHRFAHLCLLLLFRVHGCSKGHSGPFCNSLPFVCVQIVPGLPAPLSSTPMITQRSSCFLRGSQEFTCSFHKNSQNSSHLRL